MNNAKRIASFFLTLIMIVSLFQPAGGIAVSAAAAPKLNAKKMTVLAGKTKQLKVKNTKAKVKWSTSNKKVALVSKKGVVKGRKEGKATITAKVSGKKLNCLVTVKASINKKKLSLYVGQSQKLKVTGNAKKVKWSTSKKKIASVSKKGLVKARKAGKAVITAKFGKKKLTCKVTVKNKPKNVSIDVRFTNSDQKTASDRATGKTTTYINTSGTSVKMTGTVSVKNSKITKLSYQVLDSNSKQTASGKLKAGSKFEFTITPAVGVNTVSVTAADDFGNNKTASICLVRTVASNTLSQNVTTGSVSDADNFGTAAAKVFLRQETVNGISQDVTHVIIKRDSVLAKLILNGALKPGGIYRLPQTDKLPGGYTGLYIKNIAPTDSAYPSSTYMEVIFRDPDYTELYGDSGNIEIDGVSSSVAFVLAPDGTDLLHGGVSPSGAANDEKYKRKFFPEGFVKGVDIKASANGGSVSLSMEMNDLIIYDDDQLKKTDDQVTLSGSVGISDLTTKEKIDWNFGSINQIYFQESYTTSAKAEFKFGAETDLKGVVQAANGGWDNSTSTLAGTKLSGVDMSNRLFLGLIGIKAHSVVPTRDIKGFADKNIEPVLVIALYLDLEGKLSAESKLTVEYSSYHENVVNIVKNGYSNPMHYTNTAYQESTVKDNYTIYKSENSWKSSGQHTTPETVITVSSKGSAEGELGLGLLGGVMMDGVIPVDVFVQLYGRAEGSITGTLEIHPTTDQKEMRLKPDVQCRIHVETGIKGGVELKACVTSNIKILNKINISFEKTGKKKFIDKDFIIPRYKVDGYIWGTLSPITFDEGKVSGAQILFYKRDGLGLTKDTKITEEFLAAKKPDLKVSSDKNGYFLTYEVDHADYALRIVCPGYETKIIEKVSYSADVTEDYHLKHMRDENWLDICQPSDYNNDRHGIYMGDDPNGKMRISGVDYHIGFYLDSGNQGNGDNADAIFNLNGNYNSLQVRIGHVDTTSKLNAKLHIYLNGSDKANQTIDLSCQTASNVYLIQLNGASTARFSLQKTEWDNWDHSAYGFVEGVWNTKSGARGTSVFADPFSGKNMNGNWLDVCAPFSYTSMTLATADKPLTAGDYTTSNGFQLRTQSVFESHGPHAVFNTFGKFSSLQVTVCGNLKNMVAKVYLDDDTDPVMELNIQKTPQTYTIPLKKANSMHIQLKNDHDNWTTFVAVFGDGKWIQ